MEVKYYGHSCFLLTDKNGKETDITKEIQKILEELYGGKR